MKKITSIKQLSDNEMQPIIDFCESNLGATPRIVFLFSNGLKTPIARRTIVRWLEKLPEKRTQPLYGAGIRLKAVFETVKAEYAKKSVDGKSQV